MVPPPGEGGEHASLGDATRTADFLRLYAAAQPQLFAYILTMLPNWNDAEEVLQETSVALWESFDTFKEGTDFRAWARRTAYHRVLTFRKRSSRAPLPLSDGFIEIIAGETEAVAPLLDDRLRALSQCVARLRPRDRDLLARCYQHGTLIKDVAETLGRPLGSVTKALTRIRRGLLECIERMLALEEHP